MKNFFFNFTYLFNFATFNTIYNIPVKFIGKIKPLFGLPIDRTDERLSSFQAERDYFAMSPKTKKSVAARKKHRKSGDIDSRACALFLQEYLDNCVKSE